jgi:hypothetical protein
MTHPPALPKRLSFWAQHLRQCSLQGLSLSAYAVEHGLSAKSLYTARSTLRRRGMWPLPPARFLHVERHRPASSAAASEAARPLYRIALPNGVVVETAGGELSTVLAAAGALA